MLRGRDTLLLAGYGQADLSHAVAVTPSTTFRFVGPTTAALGAALLQQVEAGRLRTTDDATRLLPEFPWQGRRVTVRQLMDATSGLPDFHYTGDAYRAHAGDPKTQGDVTALVAGRPFVHEPGARWQWTITGLHLAGVIMERVAGQPWEAYLREHVIGRAGLGRTFHCDDRAVTPGLARGYDPAIGGFRHAALESATLYRYTATVCGTAADAAALARALRDGRLLRTESWAAMTSAEGAAGRSSASDSTESQGFGVASGRIGGHRWIGDQGSLMGFSTASFDFPDLDLTIVALANTGGQGAGRLARGLAHATLGLPPLPVPPARTVRPPTPVRALAASEIARYVGTYRLVRGDSGGRFSQYVRTARVLDENGRLMLHLPGDPPEPLLVVGEHTFAIPGAPAARFVFTVRDGHAIALSQEGSPQTRASGPRATP